MTPRQSIIFRVLSYHQSFFWDVWLIRNYADLNFVIKRKLNSRYIYFSSLFVSIVPLFLKISSDGLQYIYNTLIIIFLGETVMKLKELQFKAWFSFHARSWLSRFNRAQYPGGRKLIPKFWTLEALEPQTARSYRHCFNAKSDGWDWSKSPLSVIVALMCICCAGWSRIVMLVALRLWGSILTFTI